MEKQIIKNWENFCHRNFSLNTIIAYNYVLKLLFQKNGEQLNTETIESFLDDILEKYSRSTYNAYLTAIRSFCKYQSRKLSVENYAKVIPYLREVNSKQRILSVEEYERIMKVVKGTEKDIIVFFANTGIRRQEFFSLTWEQISNDSKSMIIYGKGRKHRCVPLNKNCKLILQKYKRQPGQVQFTRRYYSTAGLNCLCRRMARDAGIPKFSPHSLRHYFCTMMVKKGVSIFLVSKILGHASVLVTQKIYCHLVDEDLLGTTDVLD